MIHVSTEFKELMKERTDFRCFGELTLPDGSELTLGAGEFTMSGNSVTDGAGAAGLPLGAAVCRTARLSLADPDGKLAGRDLFGARLRLYLTFPLSETEERIELGTFTVTEPESRGETVTVTAADDMYRTDKAYTTALTYPATLGAMFRELCDSCGIPYSTAAFVNSDLSVASAPEEGYTCRQVLGYIAMLAGGNARVHRDGRMEILSYDPEKEPEHELGDWITLTPDTDDVTVTGLETVDSDGKTVLEGSEGYVLTVDNPLMAGKDAAALEAMGWRLIGLKVRRFEGEYIGYPLAECMDTARIMDRKGRVFTTVLTDVTFAFGGRTGLSCSAAPAARNGGAYATPEVKARQAVRRLVAAERTARQAAVEALNDRLSNATGMHKTVKPQPDGSVIYYLHDKPTLEESKTVMKLTSEVIGFSTDGGETYPFGFTVTGEMVMGIIRSEGISADWVKVGGEGLGAVLEGFVGRNENDQIVSMLNASADQINIRGNRFVLDSDNFKVAADGTVTANGANLKGTLESTGKFWYDNGEWTGKCVISGGGLESYTDGITVRLLANGLHILTPKMYDSEDPLNKLVEFVSIIARSPTKGIPTGSASIQIKNANEETVISLDSNDGLFASNIIAYTIQGTLYGNASTANLATKVGHALTFTGGATGSYDGSAAKTVNIPTVPASLKNPNALTFTGAASGSYDGSAAKTVAIPNTLASLTDGVWKAGQTLKLTNVPLVGYITSSAKSIRVVVHVGKPIAAAGIKITALAATIRGSNGQIESSGVNLLASGYTLAVDNDSAARSAGYFTLNINKTSAFSNAVNNTVVCVNVGMTISFAATADEGLPGPEIFADGAGEEGPSAAEKEAETV